MTALKSRFWIKLVSWTGILFILTACTTLQDPEASQIHPDSIVGVVNPRNTINQTFLSRRPRLNGITLWIKSTLNSESNPENNPPDGRLLIKLFPTSGDHIVLYQGVIHSSSLSGRVEPVYIDIPPLTDPAWTSYELELSAQQGEFEVFGREEDIYPFGSVFINNVEANSDLAFQLSYYYDLQAIATDLLLWSKNIWILIPLVAISFLPGYLILDITKISKDFDKSEQIPLAIGISLAIFPIFILWTSVLHIPLKREGMIFVYSCLGLLFILRVVFKNKNIFNDWKNKAKIKIRSGISTLSIPASSIALMIIFLFTAGTRLSMVRDLATPPWIDSVHHAVITRVILENGTLPDSYQPYLNINPYYYHPGYHSVLAGFIWLSDLDTPQAMQLFGQVLNACVILAVYLLTSQLTKNKTAAVLAALITGLCTPMPAYYTSWGRYTQLMGLLVLPVAFILLNHGIDIVNKKIKPNYILAACITLGGLFLIHYRVIAFLFCLILVYIIIKTPLNIHAARSYWIILLKGYFIVGVITIILVLPWFYPTITENIIPQLNATSGLDIPFFEDFVWRYLTSAFGKYSIAIAGLAILWGLLHETKVTLIQLFWIFTMFFLANLAALKLPGGGFINNSSVVIVLFIPISILCGIFLSNLIKAWRALNFRYVRLITNIVVMITGVLIAIFGAKQIIPILNPGTILTRMADLEAIAWVKENIPPSEPIVINPFLWGYGYYAGSDGGYWILPEAGKITTPPPILYAILPPAEVKQVNDISQSIIKIGGNANELWRYLTANELSYVFIGARGGVMSPNSMIESGLFSTLYENDGAYVFKVLP